MDLDDLAPDGGRVIPVVDGGKGIAIRKDMMNELLLVCSSLGALEEVEAPDGTVSERFARGEDYLNWVQDLQRAIRRDGRTRAVARQLGLWRIFQKKLLPMVAQHSDERELVFSVLKLLVMLTMPVDDETSAPEQQRGFIRDYKHAFLQPAFNDVSYTALLMQMLEEPLSHEGSKRTERDNLWIELVLTLVRNLLSVPNARPRSQGEVDASDRYAFLQEEFLLVLSQEYVLEVVWYLAEAIESSENREWNMLLLEIIDLVFRGRDPVLLAKLNVHETLKSSDKPGNDLLAELKAERQRRSARGGARAASRHSHFGGTIRFNSETSAAVVTHNVFNPQGGSKQKNLKRRKDKFAQRLVDRADMQRFDRSTPLHTRVRATLSKDMSTFMKAYATLMKSVKSEFLRDSSKLLATDKPMFFRVVAFCTEFYRHQQEQLKKKHTAKKPSDKDGQVDGETGGEKGGAFVFHIGPILETLDMFSFRFLTQQIDQNIDLNNWKVLEDALPALKQMMAALSQMRLSEREDNRAVATSLMNKIFYEKDSLDVLPKLMRHWRGGKSTRRFMADLVEAMHIVLKMLENNAKNMIVLGDRRRRKVQQGGGSGSDSDEEAEKQKKQDVYQVTRREEEFDFDAYLSRLFTNDVVKLYGVLLESFRTNSVQTNHHVHSFLHRISKFQLEDADEEQGLPACTAEPILLKVAILKVFDDIMQDERAARDVRFRPLRAFIAGVVRRCARLAKSNPNVFVEALQFSPWPLRLAVSIGRAYVDRKPVRSAGADGGADADGSSSEEEAVPRDFGDEMELGNDDEAEAPKGGSSDEEAEAEAGSGADDGSAEEEKMKKHKKKKKKKKRKKAKKAEWTGEEDNLLRREFVSLSAIPSVYDVLAQRELLQGNERTAKEVERRVKYLRLEGRQRVERNRKRRKEQQRAAQEGAAKVLQLENGASALLAVATSLEDCYRQRVAKAGTGAVIGPMDGDWTLALADEKHARMLRGRFMRGLLSALDLKAPRGEQRTWRVDEKHILDDLRLSARMLRSTESTGTRMPSPKLGRRVLIRWQQDGEYYSATVTGYDADTKLHEVEYDEGTTESVNLSGAPTPAGDEDGAATGSEPQAHPGSSSGDADADAEAGASGSPVRTSTASQVLRGEEKVIWRLSPVEDEDDEPQYSDDDEEDEAEQARVPLGLGEGTGARAPTASSRTSQGRLKKRLSRRSVRGVDDSDDDSDNGSDDGAGAGKAEHAGEAMDTAVSEPMSATAPELVSATKKRVALYDSSDEETAQGGATAGAEGSPSPSKRRRRQVVLESDSDEDD
eukprot:g746.t1